MQTRICIIAGVWLLRRGFAGLCGGGQQPLPGHGALRAHAPQGPLWNSVLMITQVAFSFQLRAGREAPAKRGKCSGDFVHFGAS